MQNDVCEGIRMRFVSALCRMEERNDGELLESRLAKLDFSPSELRSFFDGTDDNLRIGQLRDLADALGLDLTLMVSDRKAPFERTRHFIPPVAVPGGPVNHPAVKARKRVASMPAGAVFAKPATLAIDDCIVGPALPSPLAPPAFSADDTPEHLLAVQGQTDKVKRG